MFKGHSLGTVVLALGLAAACVSNALAAPQVWSGRTYSFVRPANVDWTQAAYQDRITSNVWLTRASTQGLFNIKQEAASSGSFGSSPQDTEWATGNAADYASLTFDTWVNWAANFPPGTVGVNAVMHLITDDIYIDVRFDSWGSGLAGGGAFSYTRAVAPTPTPTDRGTWGQLKSLYR